MDIKEEPTWTAEEKMPKAAENAQRLTVTGRMCRYVKIGCALVFDKFKETIGSNCVWSL